jgi:hypothetical protein
MEKQVCTAKHCHLLHVDEIHSAQEAQLQAQDKR